MMSPKLATLSLVCFIPALVSSVSVLAEPLLSGNSFPPELSIVSADEIGYAAYNRQNGTSSDPWNTGIANIASLFSGSLDTSANYLYLYQIINSTSGPTIDKVQIPTSATSGAVTSFGTFNGLTFVSGSGSSAGIYVDSPPTLTDTTGKIGDPTYPYPGVLVVDLSPTNVSLGNDILHQLIAEISNPSGDSASYIFGYTSNAAPFSETAYGDSSFSQVSYVPFNDPSGAYHDGTGRARGVATITRGVPEPGVLPLLFIGLLGIPISNMLRKTFAS